jgi:pyridoxamine 5'-phosphate oxidase
MSDADPGEDPLAAFQAWYREALDLGAPFADAMTLATASRDGVPSARVVLYKGMIGDAVVFHTNYESRKGRELEDNPRAAVVFYWPVLQRQVRMEGPVERLDASESDLYFATRARESKLGAWASPQSKPVASRQALDELFATTEQRFNMSDVPRPPFWGGYRLVPAMVELWIGREHRLHDRFQYVRSGEGWHRQRLGP